MSIVQSIHIGAVSKCERMLQAGVLVNKQHVEGLNCETVETNWIELRQTTEGIVSFWFDSPKLPGLNSVWSDYWWNHDSCFIQIHDNGSDIFLVVVNRNIMSVRAASCRKLLKQLFFHIRKHGRGSVRKDMDGNCNIQDKFPRMLDLKSSLSRIYCSPDKCPGSLNIQNLDCSLYIAVLGYFQVPERYISSQRIKSILYSMLDRSPTHKLDQQTITRRIELVTSIHWIAGSTEWSVESWESRE